LGLVFGLDNEHIANGRDSVGTGESWCSLHIIARIGRVEETGIVTWSKPSLCSHLKTKVSPLVGGVFAPIKGLSIIVFVKINVDEIT
jgi:hypothetical protein